MAGESDVIGEVIEGSTTDFLAESRILHSPPPFGSFVKVQYAGVPIPIPAPAPVAQNLPVDDDPFESFRSAAGSFGKDYRTMVQNAPDITHSETSIPAIYGIVFQAATVPVDPSKKLRAFWKTEEELENDHPEISEWMLVTRFQVIIVAHSLDGYIHQFLPPLPPKVLNCVSPCSDSEILQLTSRMDFLRTLSNSRNAPTDEVIAACIREADRARGGDFDFLVAAGKELAAILKDDYDRLQSIMRRVAPW